MCLIFKTEEFTTGIYGKNTMVDVNRGRNQEQSMREEEVTQIVGGKRLKEIMLTLPRVG